MPRYDEFQDRRRRQQPKTTRARNLGPKEIVRRLEWLSGVPVYWAGTITGNDDFPSGCGFLREEFTALFASKSPGLYSIILKGPMDETVIDRVKQVASKDLSAATNYISKLETGHFDLDSSVSDPAHWLNLVKSRHAAFASAYHSLNANPSDTVDRLGLEAYTLWLGPQQDRPSQHVTTHDLHRLLADQTCPELARMAAFCLGQRRKNSVAESVKPWQTLGSLLPEWDAYCLVYLPDDQAKALCRVARYPHLGRRIWGEAVVEYALWSRNHNPDIVHFVEGLQACVSVAEDVRRHVEERGNQLLWCVGEAMQDVEAFTKIQGGQGYSWNHAFMRVCRDRLTESLCSRIPFIGDTPGIAGGLQGIFRWFLGIELSDLDLMKLKRILATDADPNYQFIQRVKEILDKRLSPDHLMQSGMLAAAAGRLGATAKPHIRLRQIASWLEHCLSVCLPGPSGDGPVQLALDCLNNAFRQVDSNKERRQILEVAADYGDGILRLLEHRLALVLKPSSYSNLITPLTQTRDNYENVLLLLASLPEEYAEYRSWLLSERLVSWLNHVVSKDERRLPLAMNFLTKVDRSWMTLSSSETFTWVYLITLENDSAADLLMDWTLALHDDYLLAWEDVELALGDLLRFVNGGDALRRQQFLVDHRQLLDRLVQSAFSAVDTAARVPFDTVFSERINILELSFYWGLHYGDESTFMERLLKRLERLEGNNAPGSITSACGFENEMAVLLSAGRLGRLLNILKNRHSTECTFNSDPVIAWKWLSRFPSIQAFLSESTLKPDLMPEITLFLQQTDLALRLQNRKELTKALKAWTHNRPVGTLPELNTPIPEGCQDSIGHLLAHRQRLGEPAGLPKNIRKILSHRDSLQKELDVLSRKISGDIGSRTVSMRIEKIQAYLNDPEELDKWICGELEQEIVKQLQLTRLRHLNHITEKAVSDYWFQLCGSNTISSGSATWSNALMIYLSTSHNKRLLKDLIRHLAQGKAFSQLSHPVNATFLADLDEVGVASEKWIEPLVETVGFAGETYCLSVEKDPLQVLQMGTVFGTCLRAGGDHSYAAIANAVEVNKALITLTNTSGTMIARKLLVISRNGVVFGFRSYGQGPMCKAVMDALARQLADRCGARLADGNDNKDLKNEDVRLFAHWYNDGPELFDPWQLDTNPHEFARQLIQSRMEDLLYDNRPLAARACIFLGGEAKALLKELPLEIPDSFYQQCFGSTDV